MIGHGRAHHVVDRRVALAAVLDSGELRPAGSCSGEADEAGGNDDQGKRRAEEEDSDEGERRDGDHDPVAQRAFADAEHGLDHDGEHRGFQAEEQGLDEADVAVDRVDVAEAHDGDDAGHDEEHTGHDAAGGPVQQPADIGGKLLRFGSRQQHAVVERMQEAPLRDPVLLLDEDAVHHRDLAGGPAETEHRDAEPYDERFAEGDAVRVIGRCDLLVCGNVRHGFALLVGQLCVSLVASRHHRKNASYSSIPALNCSRSSSYMRDRPREAASRPAASGERSRRPVSAARTIVARRCRGGVASPNSSTITSNVHRSPRWLQNTFSTSNGVASNRSATVWTSAAVTNRKTALGSMNRRISHGQAIRSIFGRDRVTQTVRPRPSRFGILPAGTVGCSACFQPRCPPSRTSAATWLCRSQAAVPSLSFWPFWQTTTTDWPVNREAHSWISACDRRVAPGIRRGSAPKSSSIRTSISVGALAVPMSRDSFSDEIDVYEDMRAPFVKSGRDTWACRLAGGSRPPDFELDP